LFAPDREPALCEAVRELSWLLGRGYAEAGALKCVGDHHGLRERQRRAVARAACADERAAGRRARRLAPAALAGRRLAIDGFNCVIGVEAGLAGGVIYRGRDGALRDLASVHGSYRRVDETEAAVAAVLAVVRDVAPADVVWYLDRPVSNSGRLGAYIAGVWDGWRVELVASPDRAIAAALGVVAASSDAWILDRASAWVDLPSAALARVAPAPRVLELGG
jgi:hypothetical protein